MKLIEDVRAPNPRRVRIFAAEKGMQIASEPVEIMKLGHRSEQVLSRNPVGLLPILELDDGTAIAETVAICRYLELTRPEPPLMGTGALDQAMVEMWQRRAELYWFWPVAQAVRHLHPRFDVLEVPQVPAWGEANRTRAVEGLRMLDRRLGESRYLAGDRFSIADITAIVGTEFSRLARLDVPDGLDHLDRWRAEVSKRPSVTAAA